MLLSARRVGPTGHVYGLDMTDEMLERARKNACKADITNVEFVKGFTEEVPLPDASVDVIISNGVINMANRRPQVLRRCWASRRESMRSSYIGTFLEVASRSLRKGRVFRRLPCRAVA